MTGTQEDQKSPIIREHRVARAWRRCARLFPWQECTLCGGYSRSALLCGFCRRDLPRAPALSGVLQAITRTAHGDARALRRTLDLDALAVTWLYRFPLDDLIWRYKYRGELALAPVLARLLPSPPRVPTTLLAVPSSRQRVRERGFDAAGRLVSAYARRTRLPQVRARRLREVPPQVGLSLQDRRQNLAHVFALPPLHGRSILIVDDVLTSGGTLQALATACRAAGAGWVGAVVLAMTPPPDDLPRW